MKLRTTPTGIRPRTVAAVTFAAFAMLSLLGAPVVFAHASLASSDPPADSVWPTAPDRITLTFTEPVDATSEPVRLFDSSARQVPTTLIRDGQDGSIVAATIDAPLADGSYAVAWSVVSADSHQISGAFVFSVGAPDSTSADLLTTIDLDDTGNVTGSPWLTVGRFASYLGVAVLIGVLAVAALIAPELLGTRRYALVLLAAANIGVIGTVIMIGTQSALIANSPLDWTAVLRTRSGQWWFARAALIAVLAAVPMLGHRLRQRRWQLVTAVPAIALLIATSAGGHAVTGRFTTAGFIATVLHLAAMAAWAGGLVVVASAGRSALWATAARFSPLALGAVGVLALTGTFNGWRQLRTTGNLFDSSYGRWLLVKIVIVALVVAVAVVSRRQTRHRPDGARPTTVLHRTISIELAGMILILAATAALSGTSPPVAAVAANASATATTGDLYAQIDITPAVTGGTTMHVIIGSATGNATVADEITVTASLPAAQLGPLAIDTIIAGPNHVTAVDADFPLPGTWTITVTARYGDFDRTELTTTVDITAP